MEEQLSKLEEEIPILFEKSKKAMTSSRRLSEKLKAILRVASGMNVISAINDIFDQNEKDMEKIVALEEKLKGVISVMKDAVEQHKHLNGKV